MDEIFKDEGFVYENRNGTNIHEWNRSVDAAKEWLTQHPEEVKRFKNKFSL